MNFIRLNKILLVSAHLDDVELGAGGTVARLKRENPDCEIRLIYFASCIEDPKNKGSLKEHANACKVLQIDSDIEYPMKRWYLETVKQDIRNYFRKVRNKFNPDLVLCHSSHDFHQDHKAVSECCMTIFRDSATILGYEVPRSMTPDFRPSLYILLTSDDVNKKLNAIQQYKSQFKNRPELFDLELLNAFLKMRGAQARATWAEAFEVLWGRI
jgi:LmbE family N-acetylglucosaminyl deacetylase